MKRTKLVASLLTSVMCLSFLVVGVFAAVSSAKLNINGTLKYYPEGVYVEISGQVYRGDSENSMEALTSDTRFTLEKQSNFDNVSGEPSGNFPIEAWDIGALPFTPILKYIKIEVNITNYSDYIIQAIPKVLIDNENIDSVEDLVITNNISNIEYIQPNKTGVYELLLKVKNTEISKSLSLSFDIGQPIANYDYFIINNNVIEGLNTTYYKEPYPDMLVIPAYAEDGQTKLSIINGVYPNTTFNDLAPETTSILFQNGIEEISDYCFNNCSNIINIYIPNSIKGIGTSAFSNCSNIESISLPETIMKIGASAFNGCDNLIFSENGVDYLINSNNGIVNNYFAAIDYDYDTMSTIKTVNIKENCKIIADQAFYFGSNILNATIPSSVIKIGNKAFCNTGLTSLTFEDPYGWWRAEDYKATSGIEVLATDLLNTSTAADYLKKDYFDSYWQKNID